MEKAHVSDLKKEIVKKLVGLMKKRTVMVVDLTSLPSSQFQDIRKKLRGKAEILVTKKTLMDFALEHAKEDHLKQLEKYVQGNSALLFSDEDTFDLAAFLEDNKSPAKAKPGQEAPEDLVVEAGPTELLPGPDITALSSVGLQVKVEDGKIAILKSKTIVKKGEAISEEIASILSKLDIIPFSIGLEPLAACQEGKVFENIKINKEEKLADLLEKYSRSLAFAVSISYVNNGTVGFLLAKAGRDEIALSQLIKESPEEKVEEKEEIKKDNVEEGETKKEDENSENKTGESN